MMNDCGISKLDLKRRNRMQILRVIRERGPISRVDISSILQITRAAVTIITNEMIDQHILEEIGEEPVEPGKESKKGRRKILLDINEAYKFAMGVYVDEKEICVGLTTLNAAALDKKTIAYEGKMSPERLVDLVVKSMETMLQNSCLHKENLLGIGMGIMPVLFEPMKMERSSDDTPVFPKLQQLLEERTGMPVYIESALTQFAVAGTTYQDSHAKPENLVFLYWNEEHYCAIPLHNGVPLHSAVRAGNYIENMCVDPNGIAAEGYPKGSVHAELSQKTMQEKVGAIFSAEQTPELYQMLKGDLSNLTLKTLLCAVEKESALEPIVDAFMQKFCTMLYNLKCMYFAKQICLYQFGLNNENLEQIRRYAAAFAGEPFADAIVLSPIGDRYRFLCGCLYVIQMGFYQQGGLL